MNKKQKAQAIYDGGMAHLTDSQERYKGFLKVAGFMYRYEFDNILMVYEQRPHSTLVADFDTCLLYTSDAADEEDSVNLCGRPIIKKKNKTRCA